MKRESSFNTDTKRDTSHRKVFSYPTIFACNNSAFITLNSLLITFFNLIINLDSVANAKIWNRIFYAFFFNNIYIIFYPIIFIK